ncbi:MAG: hypothetical protein ACPGU1_08650 [Myxococcota bacterium]
MRYDAILAGISLVLLGCNVEPPDGAVSADVTDAQSEVVSSNGDATTGPFMDVDDAGSVDDDVTPQDIASQGVDTVDVEEVTGADVDTSPAPTPQDTESGGDVQPPFDPDAGFGPFADGSDASAPLCGDGLIEGDEACDDGDANSDVLPDSCRLDCTVARCGDGVVDTGETCDDGDLDNTDVCTSGCIPGLDLPKPTAGDVIFTELMINPLATEDPGGEWIELLNRTPEVLSLSGCVLRDDGTDSWTLGLGDAAVLMAPQLISMLLYIGGEGSLPPSAAPGAPVFPYQNILLHNTVDALVLECDGVEIDRVAWDTTWPVVEGASMALDPSAHDADSNDDSAMWCPGVAPFENGDLGSPMALNTPCPPPTVDACQLSSTVTLAYVGEGVEVAVEVFEPGITDLTVEVDESEAMVIELGVGPNGSTPDVEEGWAWSPGLPTEGWQSADGVDRWFHLASFSEPGQWALAARITLDEGATWVYCDTSIPPDDLYVLESELSLEVVLDPCEAHLCASPPASQCHEDGVTYAATLSAAGTCELDAEGTPTCVYDTEVIDCGLAGQVCVSGVGCDADAAFPVSPGQLVMSELMVRPLASVPPTGQWVEVTNTTGAPLDLEGCQLTVDALWTAIVDVPVVVGVGTSRLLGALDVSGANGGVELDWAWGNSLEFPSSAGDVVLTCGEVQIDHLAYDESWPTVPGASLALSPFHIDGDENDLAEFWCTGTQLFGAGDLGSPGQLNPPCQGDVEAIDACFMANSASETVPAGTSFLAAVWLKEAGLTELTTLTDASDAVRVQAAVALAGVDVEIADWTYHEALPAVLWELGFTEGPLHYDGYAVTFASPPVGVWQLNVRVSGDAGNTWTLCDRIDDGTFLATDTTELTTTESPCSPTPCQSAEAAVCLDEQVVLQMGEAICAVDGAQAQCAWPESVLVEDCAAQGAHCDGGQCVGYPSPPEPNDVVFSELLIIPATSESDEWFELLLSPTSPMAVVDLSGCILSSDVGESWSVPSNADGGGLLWAGAPLVFARSAFTGGAAPDLIYGGALTLDNTSDVLKLTCADVLIDQVFWDVASGWPIPVGATWSLGGNVVSATLNDGMSAWCSGSPSSPGLLNPLCPPPDDVLDDCRLLEPSTLEVDPGIVFSVAGLLSDEGTTDSSSGVDPVPGLLVETGMGPQGTDPTLSDSGWAWGPAYPDPEWSDEDAPGEDRWQGPLAIEAPGVWDVILRASADGGETWTLCDRDGALNGYDSAQAGRVTIGAGICVPNPCDAPPAPLCEGDLLAAYAAEGVCALVGAPTEAACEYLAESFDCGPYGGCEGGACLSPPATPAGPGALIITEFLRDSLAANPDRGEWVELYNPGPSDLDLRGCFLNSPEHIIEGVTPVVAPAASYIVIAQSAEAPINGGLPSAIVLPGLALANVEGELNLTCPDGGIDTVDYTLGWPGSMGVAAQLSGEVLSGATPSEDNDAAGVWCPSVTSYGDVGNQGSPGAPNGSCFDGAD